MQPKNKFLFNFAASYSGGGYKRLYEYAKKFNSMGGAYFIISPRCQQLINEFPGNQYYVVSQTLMGRIFSDCSYLKKILANEVFFDFYYAYGIPVYSKVARINWAHVSNVLPLAPKSVPMSLIDELKMRFLGIRMRRNFINADVVSAESLFSVGLLKLQSMDRVFISANGGDDELAIGVEKFPDHLRENTAVIVGTYRYKALNDAYLVFQMLRKANYGNLRLLIIGSHANIPNHFLSNKNVILKGLLERGEVIECLKNAKFYISATHIENSFNAASEGIFLAKESYISDIGPHRELLDGIPHKAVMIDGISRLMLHVRREDTNFANIKSWDEVISDMLQKVAALLELRTINKN
jgi:hypothetical protein